MYPNPRDGEPGGLPSMGVHRVRDDWSNLAVAVCILKHVVNFTSNDYLQR